MPKKNEKFPEVFLDFDKIEEMVDNLIAKMEENENFDPNQPVVMGFSLKIDPNGNTQFVEMKPSELDSTVVEAQPEPFVEIQNQDNAFLITVEMPGLKRENLRLNADDTELVVSTQNTTKNYYKRVRFQEKIDIEKINAEFNNGILEIRIPKMHKPAGNQVLIK